MKKEKIWNILSIVIWIVLASAEILAGATLLQLNMLPTKYVVILLGILVLAALLIGLLMYPRQGKFQKPSHVRQVIAYILSLVIIVGCGIVSHAASKVSKTLSTITVPSTISAIVDVYVPTDSQAQTIDDTKGYTFAVTEAYDWENTQKAITAVEAKLGSKINTVSYPNVFAMIEALYAGEADALFLNRAYLGILDEVEIYANFTDKARVIYEHAIEQTVEPEDTTPPQTEATEVTSPEATETTPVTTDGIAPFVIYLSGSDTRSNVLTAGTLSDVNILAVVNPQTKQVLLVNTPRDYYVSNPSGGGAKDKLTHCGVYGVNCSVAVLEALYSESITYYAQINFTGFETLIDAIGGITVYSEVSFTTTHGGYPIQAGNNQLNGNQAVCFARERYSLAGGDNDRGRNQMKIITAVIQKLSAGTIISNYAQILDSLQGMFVTSMTQDDISELVKMQLSDMASWKILSYAVKGTGGSNVTYSMPGMNLYVMYPNQTSVDFAAQLIDRVMAGEILTSEDLILILD